MNAPVIGDPNENLPPPGVRKSGDFSRKSCRVRDVLLELMPTVFTPTDSF
jgi:hypothetical protein